MKKYIQILIVVVFYNTATSQVLYNETFDNYPLGDFTTDPTGVIPGLGNWYVFLDKNTASEAKIEQEPAKGNVLVVKNAINFIAKQKNLQTVWNNRTVGNNVLFTEYELYSGDSDNSIIFNLSTINSGIDIRFYVIYNAALQVNETFIEIPDNNSIKIYKNLNFVQNWITVQVYIDYNTNEHYVHIPAFGITGHNVFTKTSTSISELVLRGGGGVTRNGVFTSSLGYKLDNIKITALKSVPPEVLSATNFLADKFNLYPNPTSNVVNITNNENRLVNKIEVYDTTGKLINTQNFSEQTEIQLNLENLASGTYMLYLQTNEGVAVKKLIKK